MIKEIYNIDFERLVMMLLPRVMRKKRLVAFFYACLTGVSDQYAGFMNFSELVRYQYRHNSQVISLEKVLNERFIIDYDANNHLSTRKIIIKDGDQILPSYVYQQSESKPLYLPKFIYSDEELAADYSDFIVQIPSNIYVNEQLAIQLINQYRLAGKLFKIERI